MASGALRTHEAAITDAAAGGILREQRATACPDRSFTRRGGSGPAGRLAPNGRNLNRKFHGWSPASLPGIEREALSRQPGAHRADGHRDDIAHVHGKAVDLAHGLNLPL